jgi:hypothetical protein
MLSAMPGGKVCVPLWPIGFFFGERGSELMKAFDDNFESARRHFGVALIDLNYAVADLARANVSDEMEIGTSAAIELLNREIERLAELSAFIDRVADRRPGEDPAILDQWWPDLTRRNKKLARG